MNIMKHLVFLAVIITSSNQLDAAAGKKIGTAQDALSGAQVVNGVIEVEDRWALDRYLRHNWKEDLKDKRIEFRDGRTFIVTRDIRDENPISKEKPIDKTDAEKIVKARKLELTE